MANVTRSSFVKAMVKDAYSYLMEKYDVVDKVSNQIMDVQTSDASYEQYTSAIGPGAITTVVEGASIPSQSAQEGYTSYCANKKYATMLPLTNEAIDDNQKIANFLKTWAGKCGESFANKEETDNMRLFNNGGFLAGDSIFDNSIAGVITPTYGNLIYDGKPFFALTGNNHPAKNGATYYNSIASLTLSAQNLETIIKLIAVTNAFDEAGMEISIMPDTLLVQYGSTNYYKAKRILESIADVDATQAGITNVWKGSLNLVGSRFITTANAFYVGCAKKGIIALARKPLTIDYEEDFETDSQRVRLRMRRGRLVTNFRYWTAANLATS